MSPPSALGRPVAFLHLLRLRSPEIGLRAAFDEWQRIEVEQAQPLRHVQVVTFPGKKERTILCANRPLLYGDQRSMRTLILLHMPELLSEQMRFTADALGALDKAVTPEVRRFIGLFKSQPVPAEEVATAIEEGKPVQEHMLVAGEVKCYKKIFDAPVRLTNIVFEGPVRLTNCLFGAGADFSGSVFLGGLHLNGSTFLDGLNLSDVTATESGINLTLTRIGDDLNASGCNCLGNFILDKSRVRGTAMLSGVSIARELRCIATEVGSHLYLTSEFSVTNDPASIKRTFVGAVDLTDFACNGNLYAAGLVTHRLLAVRSAFLGGINLDQSDDSQKEGPVITGGLWLQSARLGSNLALHSATIGSIRSEEIRVGGSVELRDVRVDGAMAIGFATEFVGRSPGDIAFENSTIDSDFSMLAVDCSRDLRLANSRMGRDVELRAFGRETSRIGGSVICSGIEARGSIKISWSQIGQNLMMSGASAKSVSIGDERSEGNPRNQEDSRTTIGGRFYAPQLKIASNVNISRLCVSGLEDKSESYDNFDKPGDLILDGVDIGGDLSIGERGISPNVELKGSTYLRGARIGGGFTFGRVSFRKVDAHNLRVGRNLGRNPSDKRRSTASEVSLDSLECEATVDLTHLIVEGQLNLANARIARLIVSGDNFVPSDNGAAPRRDPKQHVEDTQATILLNNADIASARILVSEKLRKRINFGEIQTVGDWEVDENHITDAPSLLLGCSNYNKVLYSAVEKKLRESGYPVEADEVYKAACEGQQERDLVKVKSEPGVRKMQLWTRWCGRKLHGVILGYGTSMFCLVPVLVGIFLVSLIVFFQSGNVVPALSGRAVQISLPPEQNHPDPNDWRLPFWLAVRYQVPMVQLFTRDEWRASECPLIGPRLLCYVGIGHVRDGNCRMPGTFSAEDYAGVVAGIHWIIWPILLALLLRRLLHQSAS